MATAAHAKRVTCTEPMMRLTVTSYDEEYLVPWDVGVQLLTLLKDATPIESFYENNQSRWRRRRAANISATALLPGEVAQILMSEEP